MHSARSQAPWFGYSSFRKGIIWARQIMVDVGFGALVKEFDERIGRRPTTALLVLVFLAVFAVCLNTVYSVLVAPMLPALEILLDALRDSPPLTFSRIAMGLAFGLGWVIVWLTGIILAIRVTLFVRRRNERLESQKTTEGHQP